ncbi:Mannose-6-phosphate isomerase [Grifola frondosa]|uniref:Mannose-6-phosphate isomerase n=1 Tax=Grifola frondosa TaxID=5627 RepID=A0A1C7MDL6_GRIFR|nr:Mannose-6-phosphate isomerase [Grifola frondosa]
MMRDEVFHLSRDQISSDAPNYFTEYFLNDSAESAQHIVTLDRNPVLFTLIIDHLSGYTVLPLSPRALPSTMDMSVALRNLLLDAQFFRLQKLCDLLTIPQPQVDLAMAGFANQVVSLRDLIRGRFPEGIVDDNGALVSAQSKLPVLVFARDVILRIVLERDVVEVMDSGKSPRKRTFTFEIDIPSAASPSHPPAYTANASSVSGYPAALVATSCEPDGVLYIGGTRYSLPDFFAWAMRIKSQKLSPEDAVIDSLWSTTVPRVSMVILPNGSRRRRTRETIMLWAEEALCCISEQGTGIPVVDGERVTNARLHVITKRCHSRSRVSLIFDGGVMISPASILECLLGTAASKNLIRLKTSIQEYDWGKKGSSSLVARLAANSIGPDFKVDENKSYAETWMGTHPNGPAHLYTSPSTSLLSLISSDPRHYLGEPVIRKWPSTTNIPFLFKVLSIAKTLPLQAHPDRALAEQLHARDPKQFVDANHKPEMAVAIGKPSSTLLTEPILMRASAIRILSSRLAHAVGDSALVDSFAKNPSKGLLKQVYAKLLERPYDAPGDVEKEVSALKERIEKGETLPGGTRSTDEVHAYLEGDIIECMAVSDNVLNAAFSPPDSLKSQLPTFLEMLTYTSRPVSHWALSCEEYEGSRDGETVRYAPPLEEFVVLNTTLDEHGTKERLSAVEGPTIGIVTKGRISIQIERNKEGAELDTVQSCMSCRATRWKWRHWKWKKGKASCGGLLVWFEEAM